MHKGLQWHHSDPRVFDINFDTSLSAFASALAEAAARVRCGFAGPFETRASPSLKRSPVAGVDGLECDPCFLVKYSELRKGMCTLFCTEMRESINDSLCTRGCTFCDDV